MPAKGYICQMEKTFLVKLFQSGTGGVQDCTYLGFQIVKAAYLPTFLTLCYSEGYEGYIVTHAEVRAFS